MTLKSPIVRESVFTTTEPTLILPTSPTNTAETTTTKPSTLVAGAGVALPFYATPAAGTSDSPMLRAGQGVNLGVVMPFRGSVYAMSFSADSNMTAGTCTFRVRKNGEQTTATLVMPLNTTSGYAAFTPGDFAFERGDRLDATYTTSSSYSPTTVKVEVVVYATMDQSEAL